MEVKRQATIALLALALSGCGVKALRSPKFWLETGVSVGVAAWDGKTTSDLLARCPTCVERNPIFGTPRPSRLRRNLVGAATLIGSRGFVAAVWQRNERAGSALSSVECAGRAAFHVPFALRNRKICAGGCK